MDGSAFGILFTRKEKLLAGACSVALSIGCLLPSPASAATYFVANDAQLRAAITAANSDGDSTATIVVTSSFAVTNTAWPSPAKPITIDAQGFTLSGTYNAATLTNRGAASLTGPFPAGSKITFSGALVAGSAGPAGTTGGQAGLWLNQPMTVTNNGTIIGGAGGGAGGNGGLGVKVGTNVSLTNNGVIQGGDSAIGSFGGNGIDIGGPLGTSTLVNNGTIRGGHGPLNATTPTAGSALFVRQGTGTIVNTGTIEGGAGAIAIVNNSNGVSMSLINSGTIRAGTGQANAILLQSGATNSLNLELQAGSVIVGNVFANATSTTDTLRLGGAATDIFDVSAIGPQYQNFDTFEKTGTSTWALTGTGTAVTNWNILDGTLQLGNGGTSGSVIGNLTTASAGTLAFNRSDIFTFDNLVLGTGTISQVGTGTTIMTADNSAFAGSTTIKAGTLSVNGILGGTVNVQTGGRLQGTGEVGTTTSDGTIAPGNSIGTLTIDGNYTGNGGTLVIESELRGDASPTDRLVVTGDTAGTTNVKVINVGGTGAQTVEGIKIVDVGGASGGTFSLLGNYAIGGQQAVVAGAYGYTLNKNGVSTPGDGDWYLRSELRPETPPTTTPPTTPPTTQPTTPPPAAGPIYQPGAPLYETYAQSLQVLNGVGSMQQRIGNRYWAGAGSAVIAEGDGPGTPEAAPLPSEGGTATIDAGGHMGTHRRRAFAG